MKRLSFVLGFLTISLFASSNDFYFLSNPSLTPDGQTVIFSFEGDLWKANIKDGNATRLTAMQGYESNPRVSPDGKWLAFTGRQSGNPDIYLMSLSGGEIKQLTFHSASDDMDSWSWDSKTIYFTSNRYSRSSGFKVSINGGTAQRVLGDNYFLYDHNIWEHPTSGELFFNDTWESGSQAQRKRYKGPFNPDIQSYNPKTKQYKKYTNWEGKDFSLSLDKNGNSYFISDELNGEYNLYHFENGKKTALTKFSTSIKNPMVNAHGGKVVFEKEYQLWVYDVSSKKAEKLQININRNYILPKEKDYDVKGNISNFDISPDGKKMAFVSRGELFVSDVEGKFVQQINRGSSERVKEVKWMSDSKSLLFNQTALGYSNWFSVSADGNGGMKQLTTDTKNNRSISMNKNRTKAVYLSGRDEVRLMDLKTMLSKTIARDEIWGFQNSGPGFSPNDDYIVFTAIRNFEQDIMVHNVKENKTFNLTKSGVTEATPIWSPDGKYIYLTSQRLKPSYPFGMQNARVYRLPLEKLDEPFRVEKYNELFKEEKKDTSKKASSIKDSVKLTPINIDLDKIMERLEQISPSFGAQTLEYVHMKGEKSSVLYVSNHAEGKQALWKTIIEPFEQNKTEKIAGTDAGRGYDVVEVSDKFYLLLNGNIQKLNLEANKVDPINISYSFRRNLTDEFDQMFFEAWAQMEENFYDEKFHGLDWKKTKEQYKQFLPFVNNRSDLRILLNDLLGELNSSHQGFNTGGDDENISISSRTLETGILFSDSDPYKVIRVVDRSAADRKTVDVRTGDILLKVNDEPVDKNIDRNFYFTKPSLDKELKLTFTRNSIPYDVLIHPQSSVSNNLYDEWIDANQKKVDEKGKGKIAYGYMKNMGVPELEQFINDMTQELDDKDALILDLRYNTGGNVHDEVLKFLSQKSYLKWKYREGKLATQSNFAPSDKPIVLLINEQSLSDAEMTAAGFKALKLGTIIGNETYRWIIFTSAAGLVDGSSIRMPAWGCYTLDGKDLEAVGVQPDILIVNSFEDKLNGRDPQLDKAIETILKQLK